MADCLHPEIEEAQLRTKPAWIRQTLGTSSPIDGFLVKDAPHSVASVARAIYPVAV